MKITNEVLTVGGFAELTAANNKLFRKQICASLDGHTSIEIDLSRTTFMDCAGFGALIALRNCTRGRNGVTRLVNPTPLVQQLFDVVGAGHMFEIVNTRPTPTPVSRAIPSLPRPALSSL
ncbi:MAG TPA: STAS domain-containing protein [Candidatus Angelobacter sp.]|nr:STAS domain-containing protein [Candidatus Angelobacter sp.]